MDAPRFEKSPAETESSELVKTPEQSVHARLLGGKFRWLAVISASLFVLLAIFAALLIVMKAPATVDQLVILTVPSGADIQFDLKPLGPSPVKLEGVSAGTHRLSITKDGYEAVLDKEIEVVAPDTLDFKLTPTGLPAGQPREERIKQFAASADEAFQQAEYCIPYEFSALYYADAILRLDESNQFAVDMRETVRKTLYKMAQAAGARGDLAQAQDYYAALVDNYPNDNAAKAAASKLASQLMSRRDEVRGLLRKAEESRRAGNDVSEHFYAKQALARDKHNAQATAVLVQLKGRMDTNGAQAELRGDLDAAARILEQETRFFPEDKQLRSRFKDLETKRSADSRTSADAANRRVHGLEKYSRGEFAEAITDLKLAIESGAKAGPEVFFALGRSHQKLHQLDMAAYYLLRVGESAPDAHNSALAALGEISQERGDKQTALSRYKEAISRGGSTVYSVAELEDRVARIEIQGRQEKAPEAGPVSVRVKHLHGGILKGSCSGTLAVSSTGVRFDGGEHTFASNLVGVGVTVIRGEMTVKFQDKSEKFSLSPFDAERFKEGLSRLQSAAPASK